MSSDYTLQGEKYKDFGFVAQYGTQQGHLKNGDDIVFGSTLRSNW
jgi:hypothetical protein